MAGKEQDSQFSHEKGDLVLVKWNDGMVYFAKIKRIDHRRQKCIVIFDDRSTDEASFSQIHNVDETTTDIICIKCKKDDSETPNEIVLCDLCGIGFHQKCHSPPIPPSALELNSPWHCIFCLRHIKNPFLTESIDVMQSLFDEDDEEDNRAAAVRGGQVPPLAKVKIKVEKDLEGMETSCSHSKSLPPPPDLQEVSSPSPKKRKIGRPRLSESGRRGKIRPLEVLRRKLAKTTTGRMTSSKNQITRKRPIGPDSEYPYGSTSPKMSRGGTVESHTVSVQQISSSEPISTPSSTMNSADDEGGDSESSSLSPVRLISTSNRKPRSLRVSLTLPPSVDTSPVSSATQKSPPDVMSPWKHPPPVFQDDETAAKDDDDVVQGQQMMECSPSGGERGGHVTNASTDDEAALYIDLDNSSTCADDSQVAAVPVNTTRIDSSTQTTEATIVTDTIVTDTTVISVVQSPVQITNDIQQSKLVTAHNVASDDVIIIEDNSPLKRNKTLSSKVSYKEEIIPSSTDNSLPVIKAVPGVTSLMPRRASVIQKIPGVSSSPPPQFVSTPSPLEQLQMQVKHANRTQVRRNSIPTNPVPRRNSPVAATATAGITSITEPTPLKVTAPLTHIDDQPIISSSSNNSAIHNTSNRTAVSDNSIAVNRNSRKTITSSPVHNHTTSEVTARRQHQRKPSSSTRIVQHPSSNSTRITTASQTTTPAVTSVPIAPTAGSVVLTPTTITATGEVATVYTLVHPEQTSDIPNYQIAPNEIAFKPVTVISQPTQVAVPPRTAVQDPSPRQSIVPYYTIMEVNNEPQSTAVDRCYPSSQQAHIITGPSSHSVVVPPNTTKPYAVVNAIPTTNTPPISQGGIIRSPPASLMIPPGGGGVAPSINHRRKRITPTVPISPPPPYSQAIQQKQRSSPHSLIKQQPALPLAQTNSKALDMIANAQKTAKVITEQEELNFIRQKTRNNFDNLSEEELLKLFQNAVKKFRENGRKYEVLIQGKQLPVAAAPNVEVIDDAGTVRVTSRNQVVRPKPRRLVSHVSPAAFRRVSPNSSNSSQSPPISTEYTTVPGRYTTQQQQQKTVYQTSGVFVPPPPEEERVTRPTATQQVIYHDPKRLLPPTRQLHHPQPIASQQRAVITQQHSQHIPQQQQPQKLSHPMSTTTSQQQYITHNNYSNTSSSGRQQQMVQNNNRTYIVSPDSPHQTTATVISHPVAPPTNDRKRERVCAPCGKSATFLCSGCHGEWYCSRECQLNAWDQHANYCKSVKRQH